MENKVIDKKFIFIFLTFVVVLIILGVLFYVNIKKNNKEVVVKGMVKYIGNNYVIVESEDKDYNIETSDDYNIGDEIKVVLRKVNDKVNPIEGEVVSIDIISRTINFKDNIGIINDDAILEKEQSNSNIDNSISSNYQNNNQVDSEVEFLNYLEQESNNESTIKEYFVTLIDFLFYDGEIKGKKFSELSESAKLKVLAIALKIDSKIESKFPNYKEEISTNSKNIYTTAKEKIIEKYLDITASLCENRSDTCDEAKEGLNNLKDNFSLTWDIIKKIAGTSVSKLRTWYELWRVS